MDRSGRVVARAHSLMCLPISLASLASDFRGSETGTGRTHGPTVVRIQNRQVVSRGTAVLAPRPFLGGFHCLRLPVFGNQIVGFPLVETDAAGTRALIRLCRLGQRVFQAHLFTSSWLKELTRERSKNLFPRKRFLL